MADSDSDPTQAEVLSKAASKAETRVENEQKRDAKERTKQLEQLNEYVKQMAYKPIKPPVASERIESLTQTRKRNIVGTFVEHKNDLNPKGRARRVSKMVSKFKTITAEELEDLISQHRKKQYKSEEEKKRQQILYHETLAKLQKQCEEQLMKTIVNKFAKEVAKKASNLSPTNVETESYQRLQKALVCNMYLALKVPNEHQTKDYTAYNKLAAVLADFILQALFLARNADDQLFVGDKEPPNIELTENDVKDRCIKLRALRAAKKKLCKQREKGATVLSHAFSS